MTEVRARISRRAQRLAWKFVARGCCCRVAETGATAAPIAARGNAWDSSGAGGGGSTRETFASCGSESETPLASAGTLRREVPIHVHGHEPNRRESRLAGTAAAAPLLSSCSTSAQVRRSPYGSRPASRAVRGNDAEAAFARLQGRLRAAALAITAGGPGGTVFVIPSIDLDEAVLNRHARELAALEERCLYLLFALRRPDVRLA
jgi:hypothetical protein